uniref:Uncharacterized protein n=1 Tax=Rhizophora mucronata TaxID=61149 RepID=A0A2P2KXA5_RHIMU
MDTETRKGTEILKNKNIPKMGQPDPSSSLTIAQKLTRPIKKLNSQKPQIENADYIHLMD